MSLASLEPFYARVDRETRELNNWFGDSLTPVQVRWNDLTAITQARLVHAHDLETGKCMKNRYRNERCA